MPIKGKCPHCGKVTKWTYVQEEWYWWHSRNIHWIYALDACSPFDKKALREQDADVNDLHLAYFYICQNCKETVS